VDSISAALEQVAAQVDTEESGAAGNQHQGFDVVWHATQHPKPLR
jgi:hypothetical protein